MRGEGPAPPASPGEPSASEPREPRPRAAVRDNPATAGLPGRAEQPSLGALAEALASGDPERTRAAAAALRRRLRTETAAWAVVRDALLDPAAPEDVQAAAALVVGTLPSERADPLLLEVLRTGDLPLEVRRAVLLALGAARDPGDDDEVFGFAGRPFAAEGPGGLGVTVRRLVGDAAVRQALAAELRAGESRLRWAAATALRHSSTHPDVGQAFLEALRTETSDLPASVLAETLASQARRRTEPESAPELAEVLSRALDEPGLAGTRFRLLDDLEGLALPLGSLDRLHGAAADPAMDVDRRRFALEVLARARLTEAQAERVRDLLAGRLGGDPEPVVRDAAARLLGEFPPTAPASDALLGALRTDPVWHVRHAALDALLRAGGPYAEAARAAAAADADARVRERAATPDAPR